MGGQLINDDETRDYQATFDKVNMVDMNATGRHFI